VKSPPSQKSSPLILFFFFLSFILMENLRYMLYQYHPQTALYIGCRFAIHFPKTEEGYMSGGGQIFSKKAIIKFNEISLVNPSYCVPEDSELDDVFVGRCLKDLAIFLDGRDELNQKRFFPLGPEEHLKPDKLDPTFWYAQYLWRNVSQGGLQCCSDTFVERHYVSPLEMHMLEYLTYHVHPYGLQKNLTETLPRKLSIEELIKLSDEKSFAANYQEHKRNHQIGDDEKYRRRKK
jgi:glycoprotein-N-acetylgalactosamine 3-beta-galactosyltransferase